MNASLIHLPTAFAFPHDLGRDFKNVLRNSHLASNSIASSFKHRCLRHDEKTSESTSQQGFSVLETSIPCDIGNVWSSLGFYIFSIHIPLSYGGLSIAAKVLRQPVLAPQTEAILILGIQTLELCIVLQLLKFHGKPQYNFLDFFHANKSSKGRSWLLASVVGFGSLLSLIFITSYFADSSMESKDVNNPILKEILSSGSSSTMSCVLVYCIVTPLLEEIVYRGFLVTSLASKMKWQQAVAFSSVVFSAIHFSGENFLQYVAIGIVLGCSYCWTGNLSSSIFIHSLYNALILYLTFISEK